MRALILVAGLLASACSLLPTSPADDQIRLNVADLCLQAGNAEAALAAQITSGQDFSAGQEAKIADAKVVVDAFCRDQSWTADDPTRVAKLRSMVPVIVSLAFPE